MSRVKVTQTIDVYEVDGEESHGLVLLQLGVNSHWNDSDRIVLTWKDQRITVVGSDLATAIQNARNTR